MGIRTDPETERKILAASVPAKRPALCGRCGGHGALKFYPATGGHGTCPECGGSGSAPPADLGQTPAALPCPVVAVAWGVRTVSEANRRDHWAVRHRRFTGQRAGVAPALAPFRQQLEAFGREVREFGGRLAVKFTRIGARALDSDNLSGSFKAIRDETADVLGVDDGHAGIDWRYDQRRGEWGVIVDVRRA